MKYKQIRFFSLLKKKDFFIDFFFYILSHSEYFRDILSLKIAMNKYNFFNGSVESSIPQKSDIN